MISKVSQFNNRAKLETHLELGLELGRFLPSRLSGQRVEVVRFAFWRLVNGPRGVGREKGRVVE